MSAETLASITVPAEPFAALRAFLTGIQAKDYPAPREGSVVETTSDTSLRDVVALLLKHNISSCPVRREDCKGKVGPWSELYVGVIDLLDIVAFVQQIMQATSKWGRGFETVLEAVMQFGEHTAGEVLAKRTTMAYVTLNDDATLADVVSKLGPGRVHRVIILDSKTGELRNIITQSSMVSFIGRSIASNPSLASFANLKLASVGLGLPRRLATIPLTDKAIDAFKVIQTYRVTGVPVVNDREELVGNVSARDIRSMVGGPEKFDRLFDSLSEFLAEIRADRRESSQPPSPVPAKSSGSNPSTPKRTLSASGSPFAPLTPSTDTASAAPLPAVTSTPVKLSEPIPASTPASPPTVVFTQSATPETESKVEPWELPPAITSTADVSVSEILESLLKYKVHRIYIVETKESRKPLSPNEGDPSKKPISVVTLTDILQLFANGPTAALCPTSPNATSE